MTPDDVLAELLHIRSQQETLEPGSPAYVALEKRRDELRALARGASDQTRSRPSLEAELEHLETRLREIDGLAVAVPEWQRSLRRYSINDPEAHVARINAEIEHNYEDERTGIESRITQLRRTLSE